MDRMRRFRPGLYSSMVYRQAVRKPPHRYASRKGTERVMAAGRVNRRGIYRVLQQVCEVKHFDGVPRGVVGKPSHGSGEERDDSSGARWRERGHPELYYILFRESTKKYCPSAIYAESPVVEGEA